MNNQDSSIQKAIADQFESVETTLCLSNKVVVITEDRLELLIADGISRIVARNAWVAPTGILASCIVALTTAKFQDFLGVKAAAWQALFLLVGAAALVWLLKTLFNRGKAFGRAEFMTSIRIAGTRLNYSDAALSTREVAERDETDLDGEKAAKDAPGVELAQPSAPPRVPQPPPGPPAPTTLPVSAPPVTAAPQVSIQVPPTIRIQQPRIRPRSAPVLQNRGGIIVALQCRRCGQTLQKPSNRVIVCPHCGLVN